MYLQGQKLEGRLVRWNDDRGFGFIQVAGQKRDVFLHISQLGNLPRRPQVGDMVDFKLGMDGQDRPRAERAHIQGLAQPGSTISSRQRRQRSYEIQGRGLGVFGWLLVLGACGFFPLGSVPGSQCFSFADLSVHELVHFHRLCHGQEKGH